MRSSDPEDGNDCVELDETTNWPRKKMCKPCFWMTFPDESWALHRAWQMAHEEWEDHETKVTKFGFSDDRWQSLCAAEHPSLHLESFEKWEVFELLLEMTGFANQPRMIDPSEWQKT